ncbi:hypothetical protein ABTZ58_18590 [Streptomyces sp. NPDC094143]|uniref:hypothetical protein n=1 Tax=Streptomyces sp. NPDC094143 TaxID=3155310 RepID=UPI0033201821
MKAPLPLFPPPGRTSDGQGLQEPAATVVGAEALWTDLPDHRTDGRDCAERRVTIHACSPTERTGQDGEPADGPLRRVPTSSGERLSPRGRQGTSDSSSDREAEADGRGDGWPES